MIPEGITSKSARTTRDILEELNSRPVLSSHDLQDGTEHLLQYGALLRTQILDTFGKLVYDHYDDFGMGQIEALYRIYQETLERKYNIFDIVPSILRDPDTRPTKICAYINENVNTCLAESSTICMNIKIHDEPHEDTLTKPALNVTRQIYRLAKISKNYPTGFSLNAVLEHLRSGRLRFTPALFSGLLHNVQYDSFDDKVRTAERELVISLATTPILFSKKLTKAFFNATTVSKVLRSLLTHGRKIFTGRAIRHAEFLGEHVVREVDAVSKNIELLGTAYDNSTINLKYLFELILSNDTIDLDIKQARDYLLHKMKTRKILETYLRVEKYQQAGPDELLMEIFGQLRDIHFAEDLVTSLHTHARFWHKSHRIENLNELLELFEAYENLRGIPDYTRLMQSVDFIKSNLQDARNVSVEILCTRPRACLRIGLEMVLKCEAVDEAIKRIIESFIQETMCGFCVMTNDSGENTILENPASSQETFGQDQKLETEKSDGCDDGQCEQLPPEKDITPINCNEAGCEEIPPKTNCVDADCLVDLEKINVDCEGPNCPAISTNINCDGAECTKSCEGENCSSRSGCEGSDCSADNNGCHGENCQESFTVTQSCEGPDCPIEEEIKCEGDDCPSSMDNETCSGVDCVQELDNQTECKGPDCPQICHGSDCSRDVRGSEPCEGSNCPIVPLAESSCEGPNCDSKSGQPNCEGSSCESQVLSENNCSGADCSVGKDDSRSCNDSQCPTTDSNFDLGCENSECLEQTVEKDCQGPHCSKSKPGIDCQGPDCAECNGPDCPRNPDEDSQRSPDIDCHGPDCSNDGNAIEADCDGPDCPTNASVMGPDCDCGNSDQGKISDINCEGSKCPIDGEILKDQRRLPTSIEPTEELKDTVTLEPTSPSSVTKTKKRKGLKAICNHRDLNYRKHRHRLRKMRRIDAEFETAKSTTKPIPTIEVPAVKLLEQDDDTELSEEVPTMNPLLTILTDNSPALRGYDPEKLNVTNLGNIRRFLSESELGNIENRISFINDKANQDENTKLHARNRGMIRARSMLNEGNRRGNNEEIDKMIDKAGSERKKARKVGRTRMRSKIVKEDNNAGSEKTKAQKFRPTRTRSKIVKEDNYDNDEKAKKTEEERAQFRVGTLGMIRSMFNKDDERDSNDELDKGSSEGIKVNEVGKVRTRPTIIDEDDRKRSNESLKPRAKKIEDAAKDSKEENKAHRLKVQDEETWKDSRLKDRIHRGKPISLKSIYKRQIDKNNVSVVDEKEISLRQEKLGEHPPQSKNGSNIIESSPTETSGRRQYIPSEWDNL